MSKEIDSASIAKRIGEVLPTVRKEVEEQKSREAKDAEEKRNNDPEIILRNEYILFHQELCDIEKQIFEESGVVEIFTQLRDQKILTMSNEPVFTRVIVKRDFFDSLFSGASDKTINKKIADYKPAEVSQSNEERYESKREIPKKFKHSGLLILPWNNVRIGFDDNWKDRSYILAEVRDGLLIVRGRKEYIIDDEMDLVTAIECAIADPSKYTYDFRDNLDREAYIHVKSI